MRDAGYPLTKRSHLRKNPILQSAIKMTREPEPVYEARNVDAASTTVVARPAYRINRNFIVRHFIFRDVTKQNKKIDDINKHRHCVVRAKLESFIFNLYPRTSQAEGSSAQDQRQRLEERLKRLSISLVASDETFTLNLGRILQFRFRIRVDFHQEYITFTMLLDDFTGGSELVNKILTDSQNELKDLFFDTAIKSEEREAETPPPRDSFSDFYLEDKFLEDKFDSQHSKSALEALYANIWKAIDGRIDFALEKRLRFLAELAGNSAGHEDGDKASPCISPATIVYLLDKGQSGNAISGHGQASMGSPECQLESLAINELTTRELERCYLASNSIRKERQEHLEVRPKLADTECLDSVLDRMVEFRGAGINLNDYLDCIKNPHGVGGQKPSSKDGGAPDALSMQLFTRNVIETKRRRSISVLNSFLETRQQYFKHRLQFDTAPSAGSSSKDDTDPDNTGVFCLLHRGDALYGANLGHLKESGAGKGSDSYAVDYFLIFHGDSSEQMGRLIRLLHVLGEHRHAALFDRKDLRSAGIVLRELANLWSVGIHLGDYKNDERRRETLEKELLFKYLTQLCCGDLSYRLGRADFYSRSFRERINDLGCLRIPGFQRYDDFIRRNLYPAFERHASIQRRYESTQGAMQYLDGKKNLLSDQDRQGSIDALTAAAYFISLFAVLSLFNDLRSHFAPQLDRYQAGLNEFIVFILFGAGFSILAYIVGRFLLKLSQRICMLIAVFAGVLMIVYRREAVSLLLIIERVYGSYFETYIRGFFGHEPMPWCYRICAIVFVVALFAVAALRDGKENKYSRTEREAAMKVKKFLSDLRQCDLPSWLPPDPGATWWQRINLFDRLRKSK